MVKGPLLTDAERAAFKRDGYIYVPNVLTPADVARFEKAADGVANAYRVEKNEPATSRINIHDTIGRDASGELLELIDWPATFHKVWGLMGWNIHLYHTQLIMNPAPAPEASEPPARLGWHQDNNHMNKDLVDVDVMPMVSLKAVYFLSDVSQPDRGNFCVVPGSHLRRTLEYEADGIRPKGMVPVTGGPGTTVIFDRRLWHAADVNRSSVTRKVLFYGYGYRWLKTKCEMKTARFLEGADPVRRQLLGATPNGIGGCFDAQEADAPLKSWIAREVGPGAVAP